ncbi:hypothetical protein B296_00026553 [Ensete ventricosum]|uniref:Uncharacterized protein n=1 Tax=Ensete ventricosum TaxID=4639 RepID=A0A426XJI4_ENSVE|nr:hypothetical protein B296_00026553 [Ensete ventricosum]
MVPRREFAMRFAEGIGKLVGNKPGDRRKKTERLTARMPKVTILAGRQLDCPYPGSSCQRLPMAEPPKLVGKPPIPGFRVADDW